MKGENETLKLNVACPFCGQEGLTYPVLVLQWALKCPSYGATYWYDDVGEFLDNMGALLDECDAVVIQQVISLSSLTKFKR